MPSINPKLIILLVVVIALAIYLKVSNPHKEYSSQKFWVSATVADVYQIPEEAILPGNKNGSLLMWAATSSTDPQVIIALIERGADVNEADVIFSGTPLSAAAAYSENPEIIDVLIERGAEIDKVVGSNNKTPLIIAAELNPRPEIIERLLTHGADITYRDLTGRNALEQAARFKNTPVIEILRQHTQ